MSQPLLLFCDTFYHGHDEEEDIHIDLVGFPKPVHIQEIRVIPHGCKVHANISERDKVGETYPSCIKLETFVKNLNMPQAKVFEKLGVLDFVEGKSIQLVTNSKVATNVILLRGRYKNLTVALYGDFKNVVVDPNQVPPPPPPINEPRLPATRRPPHAMVPLHMEPNLTQVVHSYGASPREYDMEMERRDRRDVGMYNVEQGRMNRPWHGKQEADIPDWPIKQEYPRDEQEHVPSPQFDPHARRMKDFDSDMIRKDEPRPRNEKPPVREKFDPRKTRRAELSTESDSAAEKGPLAQGNQNDSDQVEAKQDAKEVAKPEGQPANDREDVDKGGNNQGDDLFESLSSEEGEMFDASSKKQGRDEMGYENIESDEEYMDDYDFEDTANLQNLRDLDIYGSDDAWMSVSVSFNPYQCYLAPLESFTQATETKFGSYLKEAEAVKGKEDKNFEAKKLLALLLVNKHIEKSQKWITLLQEVSPILVKGLAHFKVESPEKEEEAMGVLVEWITHALRYDEASKLPIAVNIRMLKTGMELVAAIMQCSHAVCETMINSGVQELLISLLKESHMASSMKLKCFQALDATTDSSIGMEHILGLDKEKYQTTSKTAEDKSKGRKDKENLYEELVQYLLTEQTVRVAAAIKCLLRKLHFYEAAAHFQAIADSLSSRPPPEQQDAKSEGEERKEGTNRKETEEDVVKEETEVNGEGMKDAAAKEQEEHGMAQVNEEGDVRIGETGDVDKGSGVQMDSQKREGDGVMVQQDSIATKESESGADSTSSKEVKEEIVDQSKEDFEATLTAEAFVTQQEIDVIIGSLEEIFCVLENAEELVMQPSPRIFPTSIRLAESTADTQWEKIYSLLAARRFLESLLVVMTSPAFCDPTVYTSIRNLLFHFLKYERGLLFLSSDPSTLNGMIRVLTQSSDTEPHYSEAPPLHDLINDASIRENCTPLHLGLLLIYHLQALQGVDQLFASSRDGRSHSDLDNEENRSTLHTLYSMTFTPIGKSSVVAVLSLGKNFGCLLPFFDGIEEGGTENKHRKPVSSKYACILMLLTLQNAENTNILEQFGSKLLVCVQKRENDAMFTDVGNWIAPLKHIIKMDMNAVGNLVEFIKSELDHFKLNSHHAKGILTALRILKDITCSPVPLNTGTQRAQLVSQGVIRLFSANAMDVFIQLLSKLTEILMGPWRQNQPFSSSHCLVLVTLAVPLLSLIDNMLQELISCGTIQFKDTRLLNGVFDLHTVLCSLPPAGVLASFIQRIQRKIVKILLKFTTPISKVPESEEAVKTTTWYLLMKELLQYTVSVPQAFLSGVILLSELLPVPFPIHVIEEMSSSEIQYVQRHRMLWMVHLSVLTEELVGVFHSLVGSCSQIVHHYLQKVCSQLVDLGLTTAVSTVRLIIGLLLKVNQETKSEEEETPTEESSEGLKKITSNISMRVMSLLAYAVSQPAGKVAFLHLTRPCKKGEDAEFPTLTKQLLVVLESLAEKSEQIRTIDYVLSLLQSLCDPEICLCEFEEPMTLQHLSNSLPDAETLHNICESLILHLKVPQQPYSTVLQVIRTLVALTDHDIGAQTLKKTLMHHHGCLHDLFVRIASSVGSLSVKTPDNDLLSLVSTLLGFLQLLLPPQQSVGSLPDGDGNSEVYPVTNRTVHISYAEMRALLRFTDIESQHSLKHLENSLTEKAKEDDSLEGLLSVVKGLTDTLSSEKSSTQGKEREIDLLPPESIQILFQQRVLAMTTLIGDERMGPSIWLATPDFEDVDPHADMVKCDLEAMAEKHCAGFNLKEEVEKGFIVFSEAEKMKLRKKGKRRLDPLITLKGGHVDDTKRLRLDASFLHQRGRGNSRGNWRGRGGGRGVDLFRSRKQNTSRPPSMHVDDFVVMEKHDPAVVGTPPSGKQPLKGGMPPMRGPNSEPRPNTNGGFAASHGRWGGPHPNPFRRDMGQNMQAMPGGQRAFDWMMSRAPPVQGTFQQYNRMFPRQSEWNPPMQSPYNRVPREAPYMRSQGRGGGGGNNSSGGYWAGPKAKEEGRFFPVGTVTGYRQGRGGMGRHMRTNTR